MFPKAVKTGTTIAGIVFKVCHSSIENLQAQIVQGEFDDREF